MPAAPDPPVGSPTPPARARPVPIPLTVIAGAREHGRAALTARLLADPALAGAWLVLDESEGDALGEGDAPGPGHPAAGCPCCAGRGALVVALEGLLRDLDNGRRPRPPRVLVEAGAEADPVAVLAAVWLHPYLSRRFDPAEALAVLAANPAALDDPLARARVTAARAVVLAGAAGADPAVLAALRERAAALNPLAALLDEGAPAAELLAAADGGPVSAPPA